MSALCAGASSPELSLLHLPRDVALQILARLTPLELAALAQVCSGASALVSDAHVWRLAALRHLNDRTARPTSPAALFSLAERLICRWWLLTGAFVAGMPVHRRKGFVDVRARGGRELPIHPNGTTTCYVMGDPHHDALVWPQPAVHLSFFIDPNGPFPMDGMTARLIHAVENPNVQPQSPDTTAQQHSADQLQSIPPFSLSQTPPSPPPPESHAAPPYLSLSGVPPPVPIAQQRAPVRVTISINNHIILKDFRPEAPHFSVLDISIPQDLLYTKPRANVLSVQLNKYPNEAYWLKEVSIMPSFLPAPVVDKASLIFPRNLSEPPAPKPAEHVARVPPLDTPFDMPRRPVPSSPPHSRRPSSRQASHVHTPPRSPRSPVKERDSQRRVARSQSYRNKRAKHQPFSKSSRHMYHHNNYRSPRGSSHHAPKN